jgi:hypothetical protein
MTLFAHAMWRVNPFPTLHANMAFHRSERGKSYMVGKQAFMHYWEACTDDLLAQPNLNKLIVERVCVDGEDVVAMTLKADCPVVLGHNANESATVETDSGIYTRGTDGTRTHACTKSLSLPSTYASADWARSCDCHPSDGQILPYPAKASPLKRPF